MIDVTWIALGFVAGWACGLLARAPWFVRNVAQRGAPADFSAVLESNPDAFVSFEVKPWGEPEWRVHNTGVGVATATSAGLVIARAKALRIAKERAS